MIGQRIPLYIVPTFLTICIVSSSINFFGGVKSHTKRLYFIITQIIGFGNIFLQGSLKSGVQDAFEGHQKTLGTFAGVAFFCVFA